MTSIRKHGKIYVNYLSCRNFLLCKKGIFMPEEKKEEEGLTLDKKTMDVLVANIIPTSKYFEVRFDHMQDQIDNLRDDLKEFRGDVDKRFDMFKSDMDKRFEQVDKRFEQIIASIDRLGDKLEHRDENQRAFTLRMFTIAIAISILGALGAFLKSLGII